MQTGLNCGLFEDDAALRRRLCSAIEYKSPAAQANFPWNAAGNRRAAGICRRQVGASQEASAGSSRGLGAATPSHRPPLSRLRGLASRDQGSRPPPLAELRCRLRCRGASLESCGAPCGDVGLLPQQ